MRISRKIISIVTMIMAILIAANAYAGIWGTGVSENDLTDKRSFNAENYAPPSSDGGLTGDYTGFGISWDINYLEDSDLWSYSYTLTGGADPSHFILEVTDPATIDDFNIEGSTEGPAIWGPSRSNPGLTNNFYGIKFDFGGDPITYSFTTTREPVWGNFYAKGAHDYAFNNALGYTGYESNDQIDFIVRPNGIVPEPISSILFLLGGGFIAIFRRSK